MARPAPALALALCALSCGGSGEEPAVIIELDAGRTTSRLDARVSEDGAAPEADAADASGLPVSAECLGPLVQLHAVRSPGRVFSTALLGNRIHVAYLVPTCGGTLDQSSTQGIALLSMTTSGVADAPLPLINTGSADCDQTVLPTLLAGKQGALHLLYAGNHGTRDGMQVFLKAALDSSQPQPLTMGALPPFEELGARLDNTQALEVLHARGGIVSALRASGSTRGLTTPAAGYQISRLAVSNVGTGAADAVGAVGFISESVDAAGAYVRFFDASGGLGDAVQLTADVRAASSIALASQATRAVVVYSDAAGSLFLRTLERDKTVGQPVRLTSGNQAVSDVAIARYGIGYVVAFRSLTAASDQSVVRMMAIDELGNHGGTRFIAESRRDGVGIDVKVANDGRLVLTWADPSPASDATSAGGTELETTIKIARLTCL